MNPITREEQFLNAAVNAASGQATGDLPEPITREESTSRDSSMRLKKAAAAAAPRSPK